MKDLIIISVYDGCYNLSVLIDGKIYNRHDRDSKGITHPLFEIVYQEGGYLSKDLISQISEHYGKTVIYCEDGEIEVCEYRCNSSNIEIAPQKAEIENETAKQIVERLKEKFYYEGRICRYIIDSDIFEETLKELGYEKI